MYQVLKQHPQIYCSETKECHFYDKQFVRGMEFYESEYFSQYDGEKYAIDATPDYIAFPECIKRIYDTLGNDIKILVMLRNPIDRIYSHYIMQYARGYEKSSFIEAIESDTKRKSRAKRSYFERGLYAKQLQYVYSMFPKENVKIIWFDDYIKSMNVSASHVWDFLQIEPMDIDENVIKTNKQKARNPIVVNIVRYTGIRFLFALIPHHMTHKLSQLARKMMKKTDKPLGIPKMTKQERLELIEYYKDDIKMLEEMTGRDLSDWLNADKKITNQRGE